jgi:hypothetical protein
MLERKREELTVVSTARSGRYWSPTVKRFRRPLSSETVATVFRRSRRVWWCGRRSRRFSATAMAHGWS